MSRRLEHETRVLVLAALKSLETAWHEVESSRQRIAWTEGYADVFEDLLNVRDRIDGVIALIKRKARNG